MSPALEGRFLTTGAPGKFLLSIFWAHNQKWSHWIKWQLFVQLFDERPCSFPRWLYHLHSHQQCTSFHFYTSLQTLLVSVCFFFFPITILKYLSISDLGVCYKLSCVLLKFNIKVLTLSTLGHESI